MRFTGQWMITEGFTRHLKDQKPELKSMLESHNRTEMAEHKINRAFSSNSPLN